MIRRTFLKSAIGVLGGAALGSYDRAFSQDSVETPGSLNVAQKIEADKGIVVGVFNDPAFARYATPSMLRFEDFRDIWGALPGVRVVPLDKIAMRSFSVLFRGHLDILVYPYGSAYPMDAFPFYTGDSVLGFLKRGGAILTTGGVPFGNPIDDDGNPLPNQLPDSVVPNSEVYSRFVAPLGFKFYQHPCVPPDSKADRAFLPSIPLNSKLPGSPIGIVANNSSHDPVPKPYHGNVFPERYPARQVTPLLWGVDKYGRKLATNGLLVQDFEDGSRRIHFSHTGDSHPLNPRSSWFPGVMRDLLGLLSNRTVIKDVATNYACYRDGESVTVRAEFLSFGKRESQSDVLLEISDGKTVVDTHSESIVFPSDKSVWKEWTWRPDRFLTDEYTISVSILKDKRTVSRGQNGFIVWKADVVRSGPAIDINGKYFRKSDGETFLSGTNYYESTRGEIMWFRPDVSRISSDLRRMRECGVNYIRPHYHHLKWFKDYLEFQHQRLLPYFSSLEPLQNPLPDEHTWRIFDVFIYLCQKLGIVYGGDLFTLVPEEMGDPRGWFPLQDAVVSPEKLAVAEQFFRLINVRYKDAPCILWDLWNEPMVPLPLLKSWTDGMKESLPATAKRRYITVGGGSGEKLGDSVDFLGLHIRADGIRNLTISSTKPAMAQEAHMDRPEDLPSEQLQAEQIRTGMLAAVKVGLAGFAPWSWTRQMRLWQDSYEHDPGFRMESWDDRLGAQVHDDGTLKPAGQVFKDLALLLRSISFAGFDAASGRIRTTRGRVTVDLKQTGDAGADSLFHFDENLCFAAVSQRSIQWKGSPLLTGPEGAYLYMFCEQGDLSSTRKLLFKSDQPGAIRLYRSPAPRSLRLVDLQPNAEIALDQLEWVSDGPAQAISVGSTQEAYWMVAEW